MKAGIVEQMLADLSEFQVIWGYLVRPWVSGEKTFQPILEKILESSPVARQPFVTSSLSTGSGEAQ